MSWSGVWEQNPELIEACRTHTLPSDPADYVVPRRVGRTPDDRTSFKPGQANWHKENLPSVLYQLNPTHAWLEFKDKKPRNLVDANGESVKEPFPDDPENPREMKDLPILPDRIGSQEEEWFFEAIRRLDPRVRWVDFIMRMKKEDRPDANALQWRHSRGWREALGLKAWHLTSERGKNGTALANNRVDARLSQHQKDQNTTRGITPGYIDPSIQDKGQYNQNWVEWPKNRTGKDWGLAPKTDFTRKRKDAKNKSVKPQDPAAGASTNSPALDAQQQAAPQDSSAVPTSFSLSGTIQPSTTLTNDPDAAPPTTVTKYHIGANGYDPAREAAFDAYSPTNYGHFIPGFQFPPPNSRNSCVNKGSRSNVSLSGTSTHVHNGEGLRTVPQTLRPIDNSMQALQPDEGPSRRQNQMPPSGASLRRRTEISPAAETSRSTPGLTRNSSLIGQQPKLPHHAENGKRKIDQMDSQAASSSAGTNVNKRTRNKADSDEASELANLQPSKKPRLVPSGTSVSRSSNSSQGALSGPQRECHFGSTGQWSPPISTSTPEVSWLDRAQQHMFRALKPQRSNQGAMRTPVQSPAPAQIQAFRDQIRSHANLHSRATFTQQRRPAQSYRSDPDPSSGERSRLQTPALGPSTANVNRSWQSGGSLPPQSAPLCLLSEDQDGDMPVFSGAYEGEEENGELFDFPI